MIASGASVLIVEDEGLVARDLQRSLIKLGYRVPETVASAVDALESCGASRPALVLIDIHIKGKVDGIELGLRLREEFDLPFVYVTAFADGETVARAATTAPGAYILKPVNIAELHVAIEVTLRRHQLELIRRAESRRVRGILDAAGEGIIVVDRHGHVEVFNETARVIVAPGLQPVQTGGLLTHLEFFYPDTTTPYAPKELPIERALRGRSTNNADVFVRAAPGGEGVFINATTRPLRDEAGEITGAVCTFRDVTALRRSQDRLATLASTDGLTGLGNHRVFQERLSTAARAAHGEGSPFSLALLDVDGFKALNDRFGHPVGDAVLARVADVIRRNIRRGDFAARYGGDEFCVLYADTNEAAAADFAERLRSAIAAVTTPCPLTVSIGVCGYRASFGCEGAAMLQAADTALYAAKQQGKDRVARYHPDEAG